MAVVFRLGLWIGSFDVRFFAGHREEAVSDVKPAQEKFVVIEESIGRFVAYPLDAVPVRQSGRDKQGAVPPRNWPMPNGRVENTMTMRF